MHPLRYMRGSTMHPLLYIHGSTMHTLRSSLEIVSVYVTLHVTEQE